MEESIQELPTPIPVPTSRISPCVICPTRTDNSLPASSEQEFFTKLQITIICLNKKWRN